MTAATSAATPRASKAVSLAWPVSGSWGPDFSEDWTGLAGFGVTGGVGGVGGVGGTTGGVGGTLGGVGGVGGVGGFGGM